MGAGSNFASQVPTGLRERTVASNRAVEKRSTKSLPFPLRPFFVSVAISRRGDGFFASGARGGAACGTVAHAFSSRSERPCVSPLLSCAAFSCSTVLRTSQSSPMDMKGSVTATLARMLWANADSMAILTMGSMVSAAARQHTMREIEPLLASRSP